MIHVEESGVVDAPLVVLIHGSMDRATGFAKIAHRLEHELRIVRYDRRGYARSKSLGAPFSIEQQVADLAGVLDGRTAVAVVGHSVGGNVALAFAQANAHRVGAVGVYEASMPWEPWWPTDGGVGSALAVGERHGPEAAAEQFMRSMVGNEIWEKLPAATRAQRRAEGAAFIGELRSLRREPPYDASAIRVPVIVARGELCREHHRLGAAALAERLPHASTLVLTGAGHNAHTTHPDAFVDFVRAVVSRSTAA